MDEGDKCMVAKDFACARKAYGEADRIMHLPTTGFELARALAASGMLIEARDRAAEVRRSTPQSGEAAVLAKARLSAAALEEEIVPRLSLLTFRSNDAAGLSVVLDGVALPAASTFLSRKVNPGSHHYVVSGPGYEPLEGDFDLKEGEPRTIDLEPKKIAATPSSPVAAGIVSSTPPSDAGAAETRGGTSPLVWAGIGVGGAGLAFGSVTGLLAMNKVASVKDACGGTTCPSSRKADVDSAKTLGVMSTVGFVAVGAGVGLVVTGLLMKPSAAGRDDAQPRRRADIVLRPGLLGASLEGVFE